MASYRFHYSKKDVLVKNFLEAQTEIPVSNIVEVALAYHACTGRYMSLGVVPAVDGHAGKQGKSIFIPDGSRAYHIIEENRKNKISAKKQIYDVVMNGLAVGDYTEILSPKEYYACMQEIKGISTHTGSAGMPVRDAIPETKDVQENNSGIREGHAATVVRKKKKTLSFADNFIHSDF